MSETYFSTLDVSTLSLSIVLATLLFIYYYVFLRNYNNTLYDDYSRAFSVIDVVEALRKVCPIGVEKRWKLLPVDNGPSRYWSHKLSFPLLNSKINLYSTCIIIDCPSIKALSFIADPRSWAEWVPMASHPYEAKAFPEKHLHKDQFMRAHQIINSRSSVPNSSLEMFRFSHISEKNLGWILFWNAKKLEFSFFLVQPCLVDANGPRCLVTHIIGTPRSDILCLISSIIQRLRNIKDAITISSFCVLPFKSMCAISSGDVCDTMSHISLNNYHPPMSSSSHESHEYNSIFLLVPFSHSYKCTVKNVRGFHLVPKTLDPAKYSLIKQRKQENEANISDSSTSQRNLRRTKSDLCIRKQQRGPDLNSNLQMSNLNSKPASNNSEHKTQKQEIPKNSHEPQALHNNISKHQEKLRSFSETAASPRAHNALERSESNVSWHNYAEESTPSEEDLSEKNEICCRNRMSSDFEMVLPDVEFSVCKMADFVTQGNYGASELQAELLKVSTIDLTSPMESRFNVYGEWMFHSTYKGISLFLKDTSNDAMKTASLLCQTDIPAPAKDIWKSVKNPRFRFICDETVKRVKIISQLSKTQKIVHIYHETGGLLKKESIDFCLLHTERIEKDNYYASFHSIEYQNCPLMNSTTRGILLPSGWIVQESDKNPQKCKVTYMIQVLVNSPENILIQDLHSSVIQSVHNLKNYINSKPA